MSSLEQLLNNPPIAVPASTFKAEVYLRLHPEDPHWGESNPMPGLVALSSYLLSVIAQHEVAYSLPEGAVRTQLLAATDQALARSVEDYGRSARSHRDAVGNLRLGLAVGAALRLRDFASTLPQGTLRTKVAEVASRLGERATAALFSDVTE